jgi:starch phosphorylase
MADKEIKDAIDLLFSGYFNINEPNIFEPLRRSLFEEGDRYYHFADLRMYSDAHRKARELYKEDRDAWNRIAVINIASSGKFSSDRTIAQYAKEIWNIEACPVEKDLSEDTALQDAVKRP